MQIHQNINLKPFNTFGIEAFAKYLVITESHDDFAALQEFSQEKNLPLLILGQGSNVLFTKDPGYIIVKLAQDSIRITGQTDSSTLVTVHAGKKWDDFVYWTVKNNLYGAVNLSFIPGTVGAAPVQNIGAYGTEVGQIIDSVEFFDLREKTFKTLKARECLFGYRTSIFKTTLKNKAIITKVTFKLSNRPQYNLSYAGLRELQGKNNLDQTLLRLTIGKIRMQKLPDPSVIGNAGSFFKNPVINKDFASRLKQQFPNMPQYDLGQNVKIPAGWLIDSLGLKGFRMGNAAVYEHNALVLVNLGKATGKEILDLANFIRKKVFDAYGINLEPEVNII